MLSAKKELFTPSGGGYQISRSVRLRSSASAYLNRTFTTPTNVLKWSWSGWVKRGQIGVTYAPIFAGGTSGSAYAALWFNNDNLVLYSYNGATVYQLTTSAVYRDPSAWYHIQIAFDSTQATASNRLAMYVNGVQITTFAAATYPSLNYSGFMNSAIAHYFGQFTPALGASYFDGYLTEVNFIDGQALTPSSFGETNALTGVWQPKRYTGTYGTNGFYLNFSDNSNNTATTIGKDYSGNGNNWTPSAGISVTAGVTYDSMLDVPTPYADGGNGRGNYCVLNPLQDSATLANGNLDATSLSSYSGRKATMQLPTTGKWYWETTVSNTSTTAGNWFIFGMVTNSFALTSAAVGAANAISFGDRNDSVSGVFNETTTVFSSASINFATNDILQCAYDADSGKFWFGKNNSWYDSSGTTTGNPATGSNQTLTASAKEWFPFFQGNNTSSVANLNFGQRPFSYTPPTGYVALNTQNLSTPTISNGANYMAATLYSGNSGTQSITNTVNGVSFQPDFVWGKSRNIAENHALFDIVRGVNKTLYANLTNAEATDPGVSAFNSNGFTLNGATINATGYTYVAWQWNAGGSTVTNTSGTISSQVRANPTAGFSVVTYTGTGANATVGHGLNATPAMIMVKNRDSGAIGGAVYHTSMGATKYLKLFQTTTGSDKEATDNTAWNGGSPTFNSSVFSVGSLNRTNSSQQMVAYCFAAVSGYSAFGSYAVNNSADGPFVYLGFRARWILFKNNGASTWNWMIVDTARDAINTVNSRLFPDLSNAESSTASPYLDITANGFKIRTTGGLFNTEGPVIYAAFAENPFKYSLAR